MIALKTPAQLLKDLTAMARAFIRGLGGVHHSGPPVVVVPAPPPPPPPVDPPPSDYSVTNSTELYAALQAAYPAGNKTIALAAGNYGDFIFSNHLYTELVTLTGETGVVFGDIFLGGVKNLLFRGVEVTGNRTNVGVTVYGGSDRVSFDQIVAHGTGNAFLFRNSTNLSLTNWEVYDRGIPVNVVTCTGVTIEDGNMHHNGVDSIFLNTVTDVTVRRCSSNDIFEGTGHADFVQGAGCTNVLIEDCIFYRGAGDKAQGYFFERTNGLTVRRCGQFGGYVNGAAASACKNVVFDSLFLQGFAGISSKTIIRGATENAEVKNCQAQIFDNYNGGGVNVNYSASNNTVIPQASGPTDRALLDAWLALHLDVPRVP